MPEPIRSPSMKAIRHAIGILEAERERLRAMPQELDRQENTFTRMVSGNALMTEEVLTFLNQIVRDA